MSNFTAGAFIATVPKYVIFSGTKLSCVNCELSILSILVTVSGRVSFVIGVFPKQLLYSVIVPRFTTFFMKVFSNAPAPKLTKFGKFISLFILVDLNAPTPIFMIVSGRFTVVKLLHSKNILSPIIDIVSPRLASVRL